MRIDSNRLLAIGTLLLVAFMALPSQAVDPYGPATAQITIVAMDPMAAPLACECVQGYAQRKYEKLVDHLAQKTGMTVRVVWNESLVTALGSQTKTAQIVIGKDQPIHEHIGAGGFWYSPEIICHTFQGPFVVFLGHQ